MLIGTAEGNGPVDAAQLDAIRHNFEQEYTRFYGRLTDGVPLQAVNWRVVIAGPSLDLSTLQAPLPPEGTPPPAPVTRSALFDMEQGYVDTPVYRRTALPAGFAVTGPVIIEEAESTAIVLPGWSVRIHPNGSLLMERQR